MLFSSGKREAIDKGIDITNTITENAEYNALSHVLLFGVEIERYTAHIIETINTDNK
ncbi:hypothetical protein CV631_004577 [Escherichia coli]|nr:hypothetical protein [Escherichia coli]HCN7936760.1 hypothetical protein [Escherichia coli]